MSGLLATKLHRPVTPLKRVPRPHLVRRLNEGLESGRRVTLISAPAGFGKSTCADEWVSSLQMPVTWLALDPSDDIPEHFFTYLIAALQQIDPRIGREIEGLLRAGQVPPADVISTTIANDILSLDSRFLLILDDFQVIQDQVILQVLERLVTNLLQANLPQSLHLVLITREDPSLPLARLRANNQLTEVRATELRFTNSDAGCFLNEMMDLCLSPADITTLEDKTEGWVAGLQLAAIALKSVAPSRNRASTSSFIANLSGNHRYILSYLTEEVLNRQPEDIQQFLLQTSILDRLNGDVCNAITGRSDGHAVLERLFAANLFLISLDDEQEWYRYHHLFADLLANRLRQTQPAQVIRELHGRASDWLVENDRRDEAIQHALAGQDYERAASLVGQVAGQMMYSSRIYALYHWLEALPEPLLQAYPHLGLYRDWIYLQQGKSDPSEVLEQEREKIMRAFPPSPENNRRRAELMVALCRLVAMSGNASRAVPLAEETLELLPEDDLVARAHVYSALALAYSWDEDIDQVERAFKECLRLALGSGCFSLAAHTTAFVARMQVQYGRLREAARLYQSIIDMGDQAGQRDFHPAGQGYIGLASIYVEWNDLEAAQACLERGMELCRQGGLDGVFNGHMVKAALRQTRGDLAGALEEINLLGSASYKWGGATLPAREVNIRLAMGDLDGAARCAAPLMGVLNGDSSVPRLPAVVQKEIEGALIGLFFAQGEPGRAMSLLDKLQANAEQRAQHGTLIYIYIGRALMLQEPGQECASSTALAFFERALELAEPEGYVRSFIGWGAAIVPLLEAVIHQPAAPDRLKEYARKLREAVPSPDKTEIISAQDETLGDLSKRELEILRLICEGRSNQEIASQLVVTLHTVKKHSSNIFDKLGVSSRTQAAARARQLKLC